MGMNSRRLPSPTITEMIKNGHTARVILCKSPGLACHSETVVDLKSIPSNLQNVPENDLSWGCGHCGHALCIRFPPEYRHAKFKHLTWAELQQAREDGMAAQLSARPVPLNFTVAAEPIMRPQPALDPRAAHAAKLKQLFRQAVLLEIDKLPQLKGDGALKDRGRRDYAVAAFADRVFDKYWADLVRCIDPPLD